MAPPGGYSPHPASAPSKGKKKTNLCSYTASPGRGRGPWGNNCSGALKSSSFQVCECSPLLFLIQRRDKPRIFSVYPLAFSEGPGGSNSRCHLQMLGHLPIVLFLSPSLSPIMKPFLRALELWVTPSAGRARPLLPKEAPGSVFWKRKSIFSQEAGCCVSQAAVSFCLWKGWEEGLGAGQEL